ncbi:MAG: translation factor [Parcubacteria group bacterium]|nr:translation factor [Parcubacteria group bacterium]
MKIIQTGNGELDLAVQEAAQVLAQGGIVLFPTDTLYGLAVDARNPGALERLITLKGRDARKAISVVLPDTAAISDYAEVSGLAQRLIDKHLPGPFTIVLPIKGGELSHVAPDGTVGIRVPNDAFTRALAEIFKAPYTATSANVSGQESGRTVEEILEQFGPAAENIDLVIDDGPRAGGLASTIVRVVRGETEILREGAIPAAELGL